MFEDVDVVAGSFLPVTVPVDVGRVVVVVTGGVLAGGLTGALVFATGGPFFGLSSVTTVVVGLGESDEPVPGFGTYGDRSLRRGERVGSCCRSCEL